MSNGTVSTIPFADYLADLSVSSSAIKIMHELGPEIYWRVVMDPAKPRTPSTPAQKFGTFIHTAILEPGELSNRYQKCGPRNTKSGKEEALYIESKGMIPISYSDWELMQGMVKAVNDHPTAAELLESPLAIAEQSHWRDDPETGLCCKCRTDLMVGNTIVDLKTTTEGGSSPNRFAKTVGSFFYHIQAAHYLRLTEAERFVFLVVEKAWPFSVGLFELDQEALDLGNKQIDAALKLIKECHETDKWPGHADEISTISLPNWAFYK